MRLCITPRWGGGPDDDWYPWLTRQLAGHEVVFSGLGPNPRAPVADACVEELRHRLGTQPEALARTVLIGHSVGCHANLRFLESLPQGGVVAGMVCVAGWWWVDQPRPAIRPWNRPYYDFAKLRSASPRTVVLLSGDDPHTADQTANGAEWARRLGADVRHLEDRGHFNRSREPVVLEAVCELLGLYSTTNESSSVTT